MSKKKARSRSNPNKTASRQESAPAKPGFLESFGKMLFLVAASLTVLFTIYNSLIPKKGDTINDYITNNLPNLVKFEWALFILLGAAFVYAAFKWLFGIAEKRHDFIVFAVIWLAIAGLYGMSFDKDIGSFGDNAQYIVHSKSLIEKGGAYNLYYKTEAYNANAAIGLPLMLTPVTAIWGMDVVKMKFVVCLTGFLSVLFFFLSFRKLSNRYFAALLAIVIGSYPLVIYNTSYVMTEVPFLFAISVALWTTLKLSESETKKGIAFWSVLAVVFTLLTFLTRSVGVAMIGAVFAWLFFRVPWIDIVRKKKSLLDKPLYKFASVGTILIVLFAALQINASIAGKRAAEKAKANSTEVAAAESATEGKESKSQIAIFLASDFVGRFQTNMKKVNVLWSQQVFNKTLSRWYLSLGKSGRIKIEMEGAMRFFNFLLLMSIIVGLIRRDLIAFILLFGILVTLSGTGTPVRIVYSRYFIVLLPFMLYLMARLFTDVFAFIHSRKAMPMLKPAGVLIAVGFLFAAQAHNYSGAAFNMQRQNASDTYTIAFDNYVKSGKWFKENMPDDPVVVASRKPRLYYVYSEKKGVHTVTYTTQVYSKELEDDILANLREKEVDFLVLDAFSTASRKVMLPVIQNNPQLFQVVTSVGEQYPSHIIKFNG